MERASGENRRYSPPPPPPQSNSPLNRLQCEVAASASTREDGEETEKEDEVPSSSSGSQGNKRRFLLSMGEGNDGARKASAVTSKRYNTAVGRALRVPVRNSTCFSRV